MKQKIYSQHWNDAAGRPAGGVSNGTGFTISWQNGPLGRGPDRQEPNGAFVETIIEAAMDRLKYYQGSPFASDHNVAAIAYLEQALSELNARTRDREARAVEGTHGQ